MLINCVRLLWLLLNSLWFILNKRKLFNCRRCFGSRWCTHSNKHTHTHTRALGERNKKKNSHDLWLWQLAAKETVQLCCQLCFSFFFLRTYQWVDFGICGIIGFLWSYLQGERMRRTWLVSVKFTQWKIFFVISISIVFSIQSFFPLCTAHCDQLS